MRNAPFQFAPKDWFGFFEAHGWRAREARYIVEEGERLGRPFPLPFLAKVGLAFAWPFVPRDRRKKMKRFAAYVLLLPA